MFDDVPLTRRQLELFLVVADEKHFGRASERLCMSQPPLSQAIQRLERGVGVRLFDRGPGGVRLTPAGEAFAVDARRLVDAQVAAIERARQVARGLRGDVRVGYGSVFGLLYWPRILRTAAEELPGLRVHLRQDSQDAVVEMVRAGWLDLGFVYDPALLASDLASEIFFVNRVVAALPRDHRLAGADEIGLEELSEEDFVLPSPAACPAMAEKFRLACHHAGFTPRVRTVAADHDGLLAYVASGLCVGLLSQSLGDLDIPGVASVAVRGSSPYLTSTMFAVRHPDADAAVLRLMEMISRVRLRDPQQM
jgi:DNA-binding transcriptional LysR family regulator